VWIVETHEVPLVQVNLLIRAGSGDDPAGKFGVASLTAAMLDEGAGTRSSLAIADDVEFLGATLAATTSFDASAVRLNVPVARLDAALGVMADVALRPTFPDADLERVRKERLTEMLQARDDPASIVPLAFQRLVFGPTHRYGTAAAGSEASLSSLSAADLRAFHRRWYQPGNAHVVVVGDISASDAVAKLDAAFAGWTGAPTPTPRTPVPTAPQIARTQIYIVDHPDAPQSQIRIGSIGVARSTPEFFTLEVLNTVLGGSFTSRLNQNLREEHQYTYGAASRFDMRLSPGPFLAGAGVQTDKTAEALREFMKELTAISQPIPADELARAKNYLALGFPADFETIRDLSVRLEESIIYGLPDNYFSDYVGRIQAVSAGAVQAAAKTYIQPARLAIVVVGDRKAIEPGIRALNLAPVRVMTVDEAVGQ
jgi:predicted Zn-dependent peptidase